MKILVLLKIFNGEITPFDAAALECALEYSNDVSVLSMAPESAKPMLENLTRLGVRAFLVCDRLYAGSDTLATSYVLSEAIRKLSPELVFAGRQSMDGDTAQIPPMLAERLGMNIIPGVIEFKNGEIKTRNGIKTTLSGNEIITFERIRNLRFPSIFSKKGAIQALDNSVLSIDEKKCGIRGSATRVIRSYEGFLGRRNCVYASASKFDELIKHGLTKNKDVQSSQTICQAEKVYYIGNIENIAKRFFDNAFKIEAEGKSASDLANELHSLGARVVLFEASETYRILAARCAAITGAGLCADCISFSEKDGTFIMTRPAFAGNVIADIVSTSEMSFATVSPTNTSADDIVFSIGRGASDYLEEIGTLAKKYGAKITSSRAVVDSGKMPYQAQVGITGKTVSPSVYVAFGISGAVQHTCAISGTGTVIAINSDKDARIFDYADYGIVSDIKNLF